MAASIKRTLFIISLAVPLMAQAQELAPAAYQYAATNAGVPADILYAIALTESGFVIDGHVRAWPWTLNVAGKGRYFKNRHDACLALMQTLNSHSAKQVDVGLAQINYGYHQDRVKFPCDLLEPYRNISIAADILKSHYQMGENWLTAAGRYHRPAGGQSAELYRNKVRRHLLRFANQTEVNP